MKEKLSKVKEFVEENQVELLFVTVTVLSVAFGIGIGRYSMYEHEREMIGVGVRSGIDYMKTNGLEAAENLVKEAYKLKK